MDHQPAVPGDVARYRIAKPMSPEQFHEAVQMLRSDDPMTYEEGYHWLQGENLEHYVHRIVELLQAETDPRMRGRFVELVGDADMIEYIPVLAQELSHASREVRHWAYNGLSLSEHTAGRDRAERFRATHPDEDFL